MKHIISVYLSVMLLLAIGLFSPARAAGGTFWLFSGSNQTGEARSFQLNPDRLIVFSSLFYNINCSGSCDVMNNTTSSIEFDCSTWDDTDHVKLYDNETGTGSSLDIDPVYPNQCSNGLIKFELAQLGGWGNKASSMRLYETGGGH